MKKVNVITLGCSKNLVDSERLMKKFEVAGYDLSVDKEVSDADVVVINTCGFIGDAKEESINTIFEQVALKNEGRIGKVFVMGCLSERYREELKDEIPEVDGFYGKFDWGGIMDQLGEISSEAKGCCRKLTTPSHYAYLKIAEGCNRRCSYCAIPIITGPYRSRKMEDILKEAEELVASGVKELLVIAQDLTYYGIDLYGRSRIAELVSALSDIKGVRWIKLHYAYPINFPMDLLPVMRERDNVCKYLDIALQHCSDHMLKMMRRGMSRKELDALLAEIRRQVPGIHLRTTLMTGHPGETSQDYKELKDFVRTQKFERLGVFAYSHEEGTWSYNHYSDDIPKQVKVRRANGIMRLQESISAAHNQGMVGKILEVVVDKFEGGFWIARSEFDSPEVDPEILINSPEPLQVGEFYKVEIIDYEDYDLYAKLV